MGSWPLLKAFNMVNVHATTIRRATVFYYALRDALPLRGFRIADKYSQRRTFMPKSAVIYYSRSGVTKKIADRIHEKFGSDMYLVEPEKAYGNYLSAVIRYGGERKKTVPVKTEVADFSPYDVVFIGFPVWYGTMPNFLQEYVKKADLAGKRVIPFVTAGANGKESSLKTVKELLPDSNITDYFYAKHSQLGNADAWMEGLKL